MTDNRLIISKFHKDIPLGFEMNGGKLVCIYPLIDTPVGNIYSCKVSNVVKNNHSAFVDFEDGTGFYNYPEDSKIKQGDLLMLQVRRDKTNEKKYMMTDEISINSEYFVLEYGKSGIGYSKQITDTDFKNNVHSFINDIVNTKEYFVLVRTKAFEMDFKLLRDDLTKLYDEMSEIERRFKFATPGSLIYSKNVITDVSNEFVSKKAGKIITDDLKIYEYLIDNTSFNNDTIRLYDSDISIENMYRLDKCISLATSKNIWLDCGASIVIDYTEALTVVDVNSSKSVKLGNNDAVLKINMEAASMIARQICIRNLSGIVIVDFINMHSKEEYDRLEEHINSEFKHYNSNAIGVGFTKLGLYEITRKKTSAPIYEIV